MARLTLDRNVKFKVLVKRLALPRPYVRGLLETLWDVAHECGNPIIGDADDIEVAAEWPGERGLLLAALRDGRWIDELEDGRFEIHDYWDHAPAYVKDRRRKEMERKNKDLRQEIPGHSGKRPTKSVTPAPAPLEESTTYSTEPGKPAAGEGRESTDGRPTEHGHREPREQSDGEERHLDEGNAERAKNGREQQKTRPSKRPADDSSHKLITEHFCQRYLQKTRAKYPFAGGKDGAHVKWLIAHSDDVEHAKRRIDAFFADPTVVPPKGPGFGLGILVSRAAKYPCPKSTGDSSGYGRPR